MSTIDNNRSFEEFRKRCEDKNTLKDKGSLYVGTGSSNTTSNGAAVWTTTSTPSPSENSLLVKDLSQEGGLNWKSVSDVLNDAATAGQTTSVKDVQSTIQNIKIVDFFKQQLLNLAYPIGSIYMSTNNVSPQSFLGGSWESWGSGRVPVGVNSSDSDFSTVEKTGGEKSHTLTKSEMPKHNHNSVDGKSGAAWNISAGLVKAPGTLQYETDSGSGCYVITKTQIISGVTCYTDNAGGDTAHNNLQPYITCYMWKRIS